MGNDSSSDDGGVLESPGDAWHIKDSFFNSKRLSLRGRKCMTSGSDSYKIQHPFLAGEEFLYDERERKAPLSGMIDLHGEFDLGEHLFSMDFNTPHSYKTNRRLNYECGFDDTFSPNRRFADEAWKFTFPGGGESSFWDPSTIEDPDLFARDKARCREFNRSPCPKKSKVPSQSTSIADAATGSISLHSEESCSSAAEGNKRSSWSPTRVGKSRQKTKIHDAKGKKHRRLL